MLNNQKKGESSSNNETEYFNYLGDDVDTNVSNIQYGYDGL
jgi:hypothetical protein